LYSSLLSKNIKIEIKRTIILSVVLYGCETWSLTLREEIRLRFLRRLFGPKQDNVRGSGEDYVIGNLMNFTPHQI
jgi:hypothetical protein